MNREGENMDLGIILVLTLLVFTVIFFVTEWMPLAVTATVVCVALAIFNAAFDKPFGSGFNPFVGFINNNVILFVAMFVIGGALFKTGMASEIGGLVSRFAKTERELIIAIMILTGLMSGLLSNTGTAAILIPVIVGIASKNNFARSRLLLPLIIAAAMGGNLSLIGAPGNLIGNSQLQDNGLQSFGFFEYAIVGLPILILGTLYMAFIGYKFIPDRRATEGESFKAVDFSDVPKWKKWASLAVLITVIVFMSVIDPLLKSAGLISLPLHVIGGIGALVLVILNVITEDEALKSIDLKTVFLFGGTLALADALQSSGAGALIANTVVGTLGGNPNPLILLIVLFTLGAVMTNFMSNTATTALLVPIGFSIAISLGVNPRSVIMAVVIGSSVGYATPIAMPANAMVFGVGGFKFMDYVKTGVPLIILALLVSCILLPLAYPF